MTNLVRISYLIVNNFNSNNKFLMQVFDGVDRFIQNLSQLGGLKSYRQSITSYNYSLTSLAGTNLAQKDVENLKVYPLVQKLQVTFWSGLGLNINTKISNLTIILNISINDDALLFGQSCPESDISEMKLINYDSSLVFQDGKNDNQQTIQYPDIDQNYFHTFVGFSSLVINVSYMIDAVGFLNQQYQFYEANFYFGDPYTFKMYSNFLSLPSGPSSGSVGFYYIWITKSTKQSSSSQSQSSLSILYICLISVAGIIFLVGVGVLIYIKFDIQKRLRRKPYTIQTIENIIFEAN